MKSTTPRNPHFFDTRSVMLIAAMALGGGASLHAQTNPPATPSAPAQTTGRSPTTASGDVKAPMAAPQSASAAFERADTNHDGKLSAQEARALPAIGNRFKQLDTDHDGALSREEFDEGAKP